jgi:hypothetical protein
MSLGVRSESGHKILAKLSRLKRQPCQERVDPDKDVAAQMHEGRFLAIERKAPIPARMWACLMQFRAEINELSVSSPAEKTLPHG